MVRAAVILALVAVIAGVVVLWRSTPDESQRPEPSQDDRTKDVMVDVSPGGFGAAGGGG